MQFSIYSKFVQSDESKELERVTGLIKSYNSYLAKKLNKTDKK